MSEEREKSDLNQVDLWAPLCSKLVTIKTSIYGSRMETTKKTKMIVENLVFKKYKFGIVLRFRNLGPGLM